MKINILKLTFSVALIVVIGIDGMAQQSSISTNQINTINTAVPFLRIAPDARSGAMGDLGIAITEDANASYYNNSKLSFAQKDFAGTVSITPWLRALGINDIYLAYLSGYKKVGKNQALNASLRFFSLGNISFTDYQGSALGEFKPREFTIDLGYSRALSKNFSIGIGGRYIYSNLAAGQSVNGVPISAARGVGVDFTSYYKKPLKTKKGKTTLLSFGSAITNLGTKMSYTRSASNKDFIPANLGLGTSYKYDLDKYNSIEVGLDINKLLVPTSNLDSTSYQTSKLSPIAGALKSFGDAPLGMKEEIRELMYSVGAEYWYNKQFALRAGYFYEHYTKGNRKYLTVGLGVKYNVLTFNFSYLVPSNRGTQQNPLSNTLRFTLLFDFDEVGAKTPKTPAATNPTQASPPAPVPPVNNR